MFAKTHWKSFKSKRRYRVTYCNHCESFVMICPKCKNGSCNGGACDYCLKDMLYFQNNFSQVSQFLSDKERVIYEKALTIKYLIQQNSIKDNKGIQKIDFNQLREQGKLSEDDLETFSNLFIN